MYLPIHALSTTTLSLQYRAEKAPQRQRGCQSISSVMPSTTLKALHQGGLPELPELTKQPHECSRLDEQL